MTDIKDKMVPWLFTAPEYNTSILDKAWAQPECGRMMLNENPVPPSPQVVEAITDIAKRGNRYPDRMYRLREKLGKLHGVARVGVGPGGAKITLGKFRAGQALGDEQLKLC